MVVGKGDLRVQINWTSYRVPLNPGWRCTNRHDPDPAINSGKSGSPLIDTQGRVNIKIGSDVIAARFAYRVE